MTDADPETRLADTYRALARWPGWHVGHQYADDFGRYCFACRDPDGRRYLAAVKKELFDGLASFMQRKVTDRAADADRHLLLFVDTPPTPDAAWVFDPETVRVAGEAATLTAKRGARVDVWQLDAREYGTLLGDWLSGRVGSLVPPDAVETRTGELTDYGAGLP